MAPSERLALWVWLGLAAVVAVMLLAGLIARIAGGERELEDPVTGRTPVEWVEDGR